MLNVEYRLGARQTGLYTCPGELRLEARLAAALLDTLDRLASPEAHLAMRAAQQMRAAELEV